MGSFFNQKRQWRKELMTSATLISSSLNKWARLSRKAQMEAQPSFLTSCSFLFPQNRRRRYLQSSFAVFYPPLFCTSISLPFFFSSSHTSLSRTLRPPSTCSSSTLFCLDWPAATRRAGCRRPPTNQSTGPALEAARPFAKPA